MKQGLNQAEDSIGVLRSLAAQVVTGEVLFQSPELSAKVYLHAGLVVWAFATAQRESFQSILLRENLLTKEQLLEGIKESRRCGKKNLDDILQLLGITDPENRHSIIERHTRSALEVIRSLKNCTSQFHPYSAPLDERTYGIPLEKLLAASEMLANASSDSNGAPSKSTQAAEAVARAVYKADMAAQAVQGIPELLERLRFEIPNFLAAMVVDGKTSMPIAALSDAPELDTEVVSAFYRDLIHSAQEALRAMGKAANGSTPLDEVLISSKEDYVFLKMLGDGAHFLYVLIDQQANPGMAKVVVRRYLPQLDNFLA